MENYRDEVNAIMAVLADAVIDAEKFDKGNESAGRRARSALMEASKVCRSVRQRMIETTNGRAERRLQARRQQPRGLERASAYR